MTGEVTLVELDSVEITGKTAGVVAVVVVVGGLMPDLEVVVDTVVEGVERANGTPGPEM
jgi:6,7-dimethyl-8-ribityllumazine synthase